MHQTSFTQESFSNSCSVFSEFVNSYMHTHSHPKKYNFCPSALGKLVFFFCFFLSTSHHGKAPVHLQRVCRVIMLLSKYTSQAFSQVLNKTH